MVKTAATPKVGTPAGRDGGKVKTEPKPRQRRQKRQRQNKQTDDTVDREHQSNAVNAGTPPPTSPRRGRPAAPEDTSKDVLYAKGAAGERYI